MRKKDYYNIEKNVEKIKHGTNTGFLDTNTFKNVCNKLNKDNYKVFYPYNESEKNILYVDELPKIRLLEIISYDKLSHREIMGSLYGLNIDSELFGDIVIDNNHYYIMIMEEIYSYIKNEFKTVGGHHIDLKEVNFSILNNYERTYEKLEFIVSSLRIDTIIARIVGASRDNIKDKFMKDEVYLNYDICHKVTYNLKERDIFSIRKYGKYKFMGIIKESKKGNYVIRCDKYIDN